MDETGRFQDQMPQTIGRYQVLESIGFGAMGAVYKAFDPLIKRTLAIKTLRLDIPRNSPQYRSFIDRFYHEARISGTLSHPNIVTLFDIGEESGIPYLAMEFVEGETLASILEKGGRFKPEKVISLVSQIASAVDYAHSKGVIHRDIKPSNLILYNEDKVKVTDFGIAKLADAEMTQSGTLLGTPAYMSPEQAMGDKLDGRSDIFSLGVCAFEMLSGEQPFAGPNVTSILYKLVHVEPVEPANLEMNGLVPQKWREVFGKVLAKKPDERYQTTTEFVQDLEYCLGAWFGSAMLDTLIEETGAVAPAAAPAAAVAAPPPPPPPAPPASDEATAALPRPALGGGSAAPGRVPLALLDDDDLPATVLLGGGFPPAPDTDTVPLGPPPLVEPDLEGTVAMKGSAQPSPLTSRPAPPPPHPAARQEAPVVPPAVMPAPAAAPRRPAVASAAPAVAAAVPSPRPEAAIPESTVMMPTAAAAPPPRTASRTPVPTVRAAHAEEMPPTVLMSGAAAARAGTAEATRPDVRAPRATPPPTTGPPPPTAPEGAPPAGPTVIQPAPAGARGRGRLLLLAGAAMVVFLLATAAAGVMLLRGGAGERVAPPPTAVPAPPVAQAAAPDPVPEPTPDPAVVTGSLRIESEPPGAAVTVDGQPMGATPAELGGLLLGAHEVRLELKGFAPAVHKVILTDEAPQSELKLALARAAPATGVAEVHSTPAGALVRIDGVAVGQTPLRQHRLKVGNHTVELLKDGYEPWSGGVDVPATRPARVEVPLRVAVRATPTPEPVDTGRVYAASEVDTAPRRLVGGSAPYPQRAPKLRPGRDVTVAGTFVVTEEGDITDLRITESAGPLVDESVQAAVRNWKYAPGVKRGVNVRVRVPFKQTFRAG